MNNNGIQNVAESFLPNRYVIIVTLCTFFGSINAGYALGWSAFAEQSIEDDSNFPSLSETEYSLLESSLFLGGALGTIFATFMINILGRLLTMALQAVPALIGWTTICFSVRPWHIIIGRLILGMSLGLHHTASPAFLAEVSPKKFKEFGSSIFQLGISFGITLGYLLGATLFWRYQTAIGLAWSLLMLAGLIFVKESPQWFFNQGYANQALETLQFYRNANIPTNLLQIDLYGQQIQSSSELQWEFVIQEKVDCSKYILKPTFYIPFILSFLLVLNFQFSAIVVISINIVKIVKNADIDNADTISIIVGSSQLAFVFIGGILASCVSRKPHFLISSCLTAIGLAFIGLMDYLEFNYLIVFGIIFTSSVCFLGSGTLLWLYIGELLPSNGGSFVTGASGVFNWITAFCLTCFYSYSVSVLKLHVLFWMYAGVLMMTNFPLFLLPETKGKTLAEIRASFA